MPAATLVADGPPPVVDGGPAEDEPVEDEQAARTLRQAPRATTGRRRWRVMVSSIGDAYGQNGRIP